jgi:hypothetical protein
LLGKNANIYVQVEIPGSIDVLVDELREKYGRPLPAADLLMSNPYDELMNEVTDAKDLGSGVIGGMECDHLAFRTKDVDWQIWIAQGDAPHPCRYTITSKEMEYSPQYTIDVRNWGSQVGDYAFAAPAGASKIAVDELADKFSDLPFNFTKGGK